MTQNPSEGLVKAIIKDPQKFYDHPQEVVHDERLEPKEKIKVLKSWHEDMEALLRAGGENMNSPEKDEGDAAGALRKIAACEEKLKKSLH